MLDGREEEKKEAKKKKLFHKGRPYTNIYVQKNFLVI
jgi:hypothetical protein